MDINEQDDELDNLRNKILNKYKTPEGYTLVGIIDFNFDNLFQNTDYKGGAPKLKKPTPAEIQKQVNNDRTVLYNFFTAAQQNGLLNNMPPKTQDEISKEIIAIKDRVSLLNFISTRWRFMIIFLKNPTILDYDILIDGHYLFKSFNDGEVETYVSQAKSAAAAPSSSSSSAAASLLSSSSASAAAAAAAPPPSAAALTPHEIIEREVRASVDQAPANISVFNLPKQGVSLRVSQFNKNKNGVAIYYGHLLRPLLGWNIGFNDQETERDAAMLVLDEFGKKAMIDKLCQQFTRAFFVPGGDNLMFRPMTGQTEDNGILIYKSTSDISTAKTFCHITMHSGFKTSQGQRVEQQIQPEIYDLTSKKRINKEELSIPSDKKDLVNVGALHMVHKFISNKKYVQERTAGFELGWTRICDDGTEVTLLQIVNCHKLKSGGGVDNKVFKALPIIIDIMNRELVEICKDLKPVPQYLSYGAPISLDYPLSYLKSGEAQPFEMACIPHLISEYTYDDITISNNECRQRHVCDVITDVIDLNNLTRGRINSGIVKPPANWGAVAAAVGIPLTPSSAAAGPPSPLSPLLVVPSAAAATGPSPPPSPPSSPPSPPNKNPGGGKRLNKTKKIYRKNKTKRRHYRKKTHKHYRKKTHKHYRKK
jgi:hypothetical protein